MGKLTDQLGAVRLELGRVDAKCSTLAGLTGAGPPSPSPPPPRTTPGPPNGSPQPPACPSPSP